METRVVKHYSKEYWKLVQLRDKVLREPLNLMFSEEELFMEADQIHIGCFEENQAAASLTLVKLSEDIVKMRQVCVHPFAQGKGLGKIIVNFSEQWAIENGYKLMECNARETAIPFYLNLGYEKQGESFNEVGLPHCKLIKKLKK